MAQWNQTEKTLHTKIVYYGPALSGKTTNLRQIHRFTDPKGENRLISLNTSSDRTLFFDLLPLDLGRISGHAVKVQLYTVPGQVRYDATRRVVLSGADAVVFVADSQAGKGPENRAAWENLKTNLKANGLDPSSMPIVLQYNKQDLEGKLPLQEIEASLKSGQEGISASALRGTGVMETFRIAVLQMLRRLSSMSGRRRQEDLAEIEEQATRALDRCLVDRPAHIDAEPLPAVGGADSATTIHFSEDGAGEDLLARSLQANLGIAEQFAEMREIKTRLQRRIGELEGLQALTREISKHAEVKSILNDLADAALAIPGAKGVSILTRESEGAPLMPTVLRGLDLDALTRGGTRPEPAEDLLLRGDPALLDTLPDGAGSARSGALSSALAVPMFPVLRPPFLLLVYGDVPFSPDDLRFLGLLGAHSAVCLDNVTMTRRLRVYNERLEKEVQSRTKLLERANEELRELDRMKDRFLSSVSHEMKTPLTGIISGADLLFSLTPEGDERREFVSMIAQEGKRLASLVDQTLRFQVLGRRNPAGAMTPVDPLAVITAKLRDLGPAMTSRKIDLTSELPHGLAAVTGDAEGLTLAFHEILDNAIKFSPVGGKVWVRAREETMAALPGTDGTAPGAGGVLDSRGPVLADYVVITVGDAGPGIPPDQHARIFEKFEQLGNILTSKPEGLGLGLPIAREIALRHGGDLRVDSEVGIGSEFHLYLPAASKPAVEPVTARVEVLR